MKNKITSRDIERFWDKVNIPNGKGCWNWKASIMNSGYGQFFIYPLPTRKVIALSSHRFSYVIAFGNIPKGMCVLHKCDNKICVNPNHLFLGTHSDNLYDCVKKGRHKSNSKKMQGEKNPNSRLREKDIITIRKLFSNGKFSMKELSEKYNVTRTHINYIINKQTWKHLGEAK